jgi:hypothetical protein
MKIFGYKDKVISEHDLLQMAEITTQAPPETLRAIAKFINESADHIGNYKGDFGHAHLQYEWSGWQESYPDIIAK